MRILIWQQFGNIAVYCVETLEQMHAVAKLISNHLKSCGNIEDEFDFNEQYNEFAEQCKQSPNGRSFADDYNELKQIIEYGVDLFGVGTHEAIEKFEFALVKYPEK